MQRNRRSRSRVAHLPGTLQLASPYCCRLHWAATATAPRASQSRFVLENPKK
jgi:hypothetical protein